MMRLKSQSNAIRIQLSHPGDRRDIHGNCCASQNTDNGFFCVIHGCALIRKYSAEVMKTWIY